MSLADLGVTIIGIVIFLWDLLTIPIYFLLQRPWTVTARKHRTRSRIISHQPGEITFRAVPQVCNFKDEIKASSDKINTMEKLFKYCVKKYGFKRCLGTRVILGEEDEKQPNGKVFTKLQMGDYSWMAYVDVAARAEQLGKGLRELGLQPKDKVVVYANTSAEWMVTSIACFKHALALVTIYTNLGEEGVAHGITQTDASVVVVSADLLPRLAAVLPQATAVHTVVVIPIHKPHTTPTVENVKFHSIDEVIAMGSRSQVVAFPPEPEDTAIIMYTSGSTGVPKGVVLTHKNLIQGTLGLMSVAAESMEGQVLPHECYIAYLPLAHVLELLGENVFMSMGVPLGYSTTNTLLDTSTMVAKGYKGDATLLQPTLMCAVPLVMDRVYKGIKAGIKKKGGFMTALIDYCYQYKLKWVSRGYNTPIMNKLIFSKFSQVLGGRVRVLLSGGAPLAPDTHSFVRTCLNTCLLQGYGLTETAATGSVTDFYDQSTGRVGPPVQDVDIKLVNWEEGGYTVTDQQGPRGEIVIGGGNVAKEYYLMPDKTEEEFYNENGKRWFKTGDIGHYCDNGVLRIIDRKKDLVKLQGGEYVSLGKVESLLKIHPLVENLCVYGDPSRSNTVALVIPDQAMLTEIGQQLGLDGKEREEVCQDPAMVKEVLKILVKHGLEQKLAKFEIPQAIYLVAEAWTPESGLVTAAMKLKRKSIESVFQDEIMGMYGEGENGNYLAKKPQATNNNTKPVKNV